MAAVVPRITVVALAALLSGTVLLSCGPSQAANRRVDDVRRIESTFASLGSLHLEAYRDQAWCRNIKYQRGAFSETESPTTCNLFDVVRVSEFDDQARADFGTVNHLLAEAGLNTIYVNLDYEEDGRVAAAAFAVRCLGCDDGSYVYRAAANWSSDDIDATDFVTATWRWRPD